MSHPTWTLERALLLIRGLQPDVRALDYHICLGGGVLNTGTSDKDLDLFILPLHGSDREKRQDLWLLLNNILGPLHALRDAPDYHAEEGFQSSEQYKGQYLSRRVDIFIV